MPGQRATKREREVTADDAAFEAADVAHGRLEALGVDKEGFSVLLRDTLAEVRGTKGPDGIAEVVCELRELIEVQRALLQERKETNRWLREVVGLKRHPDAPAHVTERAVRDETPIARDAENHRPAKRTCVGFGGQRPVSGGYGYHQVRLPEPLPQPTQGITQTLASLQSGTQQTVQQKMAERGLADKEQFMKAWQALSEGTTIFTFDGEAYYYNQ
ncbi:hypothetical protein KIPB_007228 [Kipferlia bialata]|uniref:Uncharacterized protein n=1 Tax=Kipferlia bialata TaxID=797122 RepID=A0A391NNU3_9EUKA|nr:hypothetical protein KIPB_004790 [Kipferlia bialata]GCA62650.1 hypothetical protein KIPB_004857 [Kipferlia bialata]GCA63002.1 hypothetical protein KIPB_007228 [Kipferlia bialata]|eukprot:g4790.t1